MFKQFQRTIMKRRQLLSSLTATGGLALAGCVAVPEPGGEEEVENVEILDHELVRENVGTDEEEVAVVGRVRIRNEDEVRYVELRVVFFDEEDQPLDSTVQNVEGIGEGPDVSFRVTYPYVGDRAREVADYEIAIETIL